MCNHRFEFICILLWARCINGLTEYFSELSEIWNLTLKTNQFGLRCVQLASVLPFLLIFASYLPSVLEAGWLTAAYANHTFWCADDNISCTLHPHRVASYSVCLLNTQRCLFLWNQTHHYPVCLLRQSVFPAGITAQQTNWLSAHGCRFRSSNGTQWYWRPLEDLW